MAAKGRGLFSLYIYIEKLTVSMDGRIQGWKEGRMNPF